MPIYEYECRKCGHKFERMEHFNSSPKKTCPECKGKAERVFSTGIGFIFKGSGFYATDYAKKRPKSGDEDEPVKPVKETKDKKE
jgi:putative FmdB family regulatory protein